jgi:hypothetical protein
MCSNATDVEVIPLKHAIASDLAPLVLRLIDSGGGAAVPGARPMVLSRPRWWPSRVATP